MPKINPLDLLKVKKIVEEEAGIIAQDKDLFLIPLGEEWKKHLKEGFDVEEETQKAWKRIKKTGLGFIFKNSNIKIEDIRKALEKIKGGKYA